MLNESSKKELLIQLITRKIYIIEDKHILPDSDQLTILFCFIFVFMWQLINHDTE